MKTFETAGPISITVEFGVGDIQIAGSDRTNAVVEVRPTDVGKHGDVTAAARTRVEYANGRLLVRGPRGRQWTPWGDRGSVDVQIQVPAGSTIWGEADAAALRCDGRIGRCRLRTGVGDIVVDEAGPGELRTGAGDVTVGRLEGSADVKTGSGAVSIGSIAGTAFVRNGNGDTWIGAVMGHARVSAGNGTISIDRAQDGVVAKTANGRVRIGEVVRGAVVAQSAFGTIEIGVRDGVPAWLDLDTKFGTVQNDLDAGERPGPAEEAVEIHARTTMGDITIHRFIASHTGRER